MENTKTLRWIEEVFTKSGHMRYSEEVTELEHALQAATFAQRNDEPDSVVVACLLHDFGHLCHDLGEDIAERGIDARHEEVGAEILAEHFPASIIEPIRMHVDAKRYLCGVDSEYLAGLSEASRQSLMLQGGPMNESEIAEFEANPFFEIAVRVRKYDDQGKVVDMDTPSLTHFLPLIGEFAI